INRSSEKLLATSLSLFVAACVGAILNVLVFSQATEDAVEFPVEFRIRKETGTPYELPIYTGPQFHAIAIAVLERTLSKDAFASLDLSNTRRQPNFYLQVLQWRV